jgi:hypothetical protein
VARQVRRQDIGGVAQPRCSRATSGGSNLSGRIVRFATNLAVVSVPVATETLVERLPGQAQEAGGHALIALRTPQRFRDEVVFGFSECWQAIGEDAGRVGFLRGQYNEVRNTWAVGTRRRYRVGPEHRRAVKTR